VLIGIAAMIAGLFLLLRDAAPLLQAHRSGVIHTRGHQRRRVERAAEPERFANLVHQRRQGLNGPMALTLAGFGWTVWQLLALTGVFLQARAGA
jgi:hypothetical protein